jgi:hypothetical protein
LNLGFLGLTFPFDGEAPSGFVGTAATGGASAVAAGAWSLIEDGSLIQKRQVVCRTK